MSENPTVKDSLTAPNPGSQEAVERGCRCDVIDNHYGKGFPYGGDEPSFYISMDCPLHGHTVQKQP